MHAIQFIEILKDLFFLKIEPIIISGKYMSKNVDWNFPIFHEQEDHET
jgi:hypothetical protein